jgi:hypothetical protein
MADPDIGWLTVVASGIEALADSSDSGGSPDYNPLVGTVVLTPSTTRPLRVVSLGILIAVGPVTVVFDSEGELSYDGVKDVRLVAPQWPDLSNTEWRWQASVTPGPGQSWQPFSGSFTGAPGSTFNLATLLG